jgi:hypothetical protein
MLAGWLHSRSLRHKTTMRPVPVAHSATKWQNFLCAVVSAKIAVQSRNNLIAKGFFGGCRHEIYSSCWLSDIVGINEIGDSAANDIRHGVRGGEGIEGLFIRQAAKASQRRCGRQMPERLLKKAVDNDRA